MSVTVDLSGKDASVLNSSVVTDVSSNDNNCSDAIHDKGSVNLVTIPKTSLQSNTDKFGGVKHGSNHDPGHCGNEAETDAISTSLNEYGGKNKLLTTNVKIVSNVISDYLLTRTGDAPCADQGERKVEPVKTNIVKKTTGRQCGSVTIYPCETELRQNCIVLKNDNCSSFEQTAPGTNLLSESNYSSSSLLSPPPLSGSKKALNTSSKILTSVSQMATCSVINTSNVNTSTINSTPTSSIASTVCSTRTVKSLSADDRNPSGSCLVTSPGIHVVLPSNPSVLPSSSSPVSQTQGTVVTAFLAPVQTSPKRTITHSATSPALLKSSQPSVVHAATLSGTKILVAQPSSVVNGQLRPGIIPVSSGGATILVAQASSVLNVPSKTATTTSSLSVNLNTVGQRKYVTTTATRLTIPYTQGNVRTATLPLGSTVPRTISSTSGNNSLPIAFSITPSKTVISSTTSSSSVTRSLSLLSTAISSSEKPSPFIVPSTTSATTAALGNKLIINVKQKVSPTTVNGNSPTSVNFPVNNNSPVTIATSPISSSAFITSSSSTLKYCGLPYQDHNYGAPPPPTPPQSPSPPPPPIFSPRKDSLDSTVISVDEDTNTSVLSSESTETAASTNGEEIDVTVNGSCFSLPLKSSIPNSVGDEQGITRCICEFNHDDEYMICCDKCLVWQHVECMGINKNEIPDTYLCERCLPRKIDIKRAKSLQTRKKGKLRPVTCSDTSSADESKDENRNKQTELKAKRVKRRESKFDKMTIKKKLKMKNKIKINMKKVNLRMKRKKNRAVRVSSGKDEESKDGWDNNLLREWIDKYEEALINQYTPEIQLLVSSLQLNGQNEELLRRASKQLRSQLCRVTWNASNGRKLVATCDLDVNQPIIEYRGKFISLSQFKQQNPVFSNKSFPFVLFYSPGNNQEDVCVDAREYGNTARFVRRSCTPNAEVRHLVENGLLHLYLFAVRRIRKDEEITISFDFNYRKCVNKVECACSLEKCPVATVIVKKNGISANGDKNANSDISKSCAQKVKKKRMKKKCLEETSVKEKVENRKSPKLLKSPPPSPVKQSKKPMSPVKVSNPDENIVATLDDQTPVSTDESKPAETTETAEQSTEGKKKMTREERKMEAIMKAFEKMEQSEKRKQQALERSAHKHEEDDKSKTVDNKESEVKESNDDKGGSVPIPSSAEDEDTNAAVKQDNNSCDEANQTKPLILSKPRRGKRRKSGTTPRKRLRTVSGSSDHSAALTSADENGTVTSCSQSTPAMPLMADVDNLKMSPASSCQFRFPKTKKSMMTEWFHEKFDNPPPAGQILSPNSRSFKMDVGHNSHSQYTPPLAIDYFTTGSPTCFVRSSRGANTGISAAHLRRNSYSEKDKQSSSTDSMMGSAKKRWLRQVMHDEETVNDSSVVPSVGSPLHSPCSSPPTDNITPLKKRRLMRESMSSDLSAPPSPSVANNNLFFERTNSESCETKCENRLVDIDELKSEDVEADDCVKTEKCANLESSEMKEQEVICNEPAVVRVEDVSRENSFECEKSADEESNKVGCESVAPEISPTLKAEELADLKSECYDLKTETTHKSEIVEAVESDDENVKMEICANVDEKPDADKIKSELTTSDASIVDCKDSNIMSESIGGNESKLEHHEVKTEMKTEDVCEKDADDNEVIEPCKVESEKLECNDNSLWEMKNGFDANESLDCFESDKEKLISEESNMSSNDIQEGLTSSDNSKQLNSELKDLITAPIKRKVSLSEYRQRKNITKQSSSTSSTSTSFITSLTTSNSNSRTTTPDSNSVSPLNLPPLPVNILLSGKMSPKISISSMPIFNTVTKIENKRPKSPPPLASSLSKHSPFKTIVKDKPSVNTEMKKPKQTVKTEDKESEWNSAPKSFEKIAEQREDLTQRLKREFGLLSDSETSSQLSSTAVLGDKSDDDDPPPPPPPPPKPPGHPIHHKQNVHRKSVNKDQDVPPPPPPPPRRPPPAVIATGTAAAINQPSIYHQSSAYVAVSSAIGYPAVYNQAPANYVQGQPAGYPVNNAPYVNPSHVQPGAVVMYPHQPPALPPQSRSSYNGYSSHNNGNKYHNRRRQDYY